ncbi:DUF3269 family protein, partial [Staphylococcus aureus]|nr:DUF3269 family protein [Staphylococcus aureus]HDF6285263.1 DUF3269 family protein [Staphylococcus aureus]HDF6285274.1 DUF3269 family protein [Staphylococcus aureus]HDF6890465.1 DUF3269 family protein [Staphylococcus aureus]HDF6890476.1 DUF3269 family protein [Staphylococcus aureus]
LYEQELGLQATIFDI